MPEALTHNHPSGVRHGAPRHSPGRHRA